MSTWHVVVRGKWGGVRSFSVRARSASEARREASAQMRSDESIQSITKES